MEGREDGAQRITGPHFNTRTSEEDWLRLLRMSSSDDVSFEKLSVAMQNCGGVPFTVIRAANSAVIGAGGEIRSLRHALAVLGLRKIRELLAEQVTNSSSRPARVAV